MSELDFSRRFPPPNPNPTLYTISPSGSKGLGCFAKQPLRLGTHLVTEEPLFTLPSDQTTALSVEQKVNSLPGNSQSGFSLCDNKKDGCDSKKDGHNYWTALAIYKRNRLPLDANGLFGLFIHASRFNHSCMPNAYLYYDEPKKQMCIHVLALEIAEGEEITIDYLYNSVYDTVSARRQALKRWDFKCDCAACEYAPEEENQQSKIQARRMKIRSLQDSVVSTAGTTQSPMQRGAEFIQLSRLLVDAARDGDHLYEPRSCFLKLLAEWHLGCAVTARFDKDGASWRRKTLESAEECTREKLKLDRDATGVASSKVAVTESWMDAMGLYT